MREIGIKKEKESTPKKKDTVESLIKEYFLKHPQKDLNHDPVVDYVEERYIEIHGSKPRDVWRGIRKLHEKGFLIQVTKGIYRYDPEHAEQKETHDFSNAIKEKIFKRDDYKCVMCGRGKAEGIEIQADHKKSKDKGGKSTLENGQTLCSQHNYWKKNYSQTEFAKKYYSKLYTKAIKLHDKKMMDFCKEILVVYKKYDIDSHIDTFS